MKTFRSRALIEDVNQKQGQHEVKNAYWSESGVLVVRNKLPYGDYILAPPVVVDTKRDVMELAQNVKGDHRRFRDAAILAQSCGSHLVILTENDDGIADLDGLRSWNEPERSYRSRLKRNARAVRYDGRSLSVACRTMESRYGLEFDFCTPGEAGRRVMMHLGVMM